MTKSEENNPSDVDECAAVMYTSIIAPHKKRPCQYTKPTKKGKSGQSLDEKARHRVSARRRRGEQGVVSAHIHRSAERQFISIWLADKDAWMPRSDSRLHRTARQMRSDDFEFNRKALIGHGATGPSRQCP